MGIDFLKYLFCRNCTVASLNSTSFEGSWFRIGGYITFKQADISETCFLFPQSSFT